MASKSTSLSVNKKSYMAYIPAAVIAVGIAVASLIERPQDLLDIHTSDKVLHGLMYTILTLSVMAGVYRTRSESVRACLWVIVAVTGYGALMEWLQYACTETRSGEWLDIAADLAGAIAGVAVAVIIERVWRKTTHTTSH